MQHNSSMTVNKHLKNGYRITREMDNDRNADRNVSICELKKRNSPTLYVLCTNAWADDQYESWKDVKKAMKTETSLVSE